MSGVIEQTPGEILDWTVDWSARGLGTDTISTSNWTASSSDFSLSNASNTNTTTTIWVTGGIPGNAYFITNTVVTAGGRKMSESIPYVCIPKRTI